MIFIYIKLYFYFCKEAGYVVNDKVKTRIQDELIKAGLKKAEFVFVA